MGQTANSYLTTFSILYTSKVILLRVICKIETFIKEIINWITEKKTDYSKINVI